MMAEGEFYLKVCLKNLMVNDGMYNWDGVFKHLNSCWFGVFGERNGRNTKIIPSSISYHKATYIGVWLSKPSKYLLRLSDHVSQTSKYQ